MIVKSATCRQDCGRSMKKRQALTWAVEELLIHYLWEINIFCNKYIHTSICHSFRKTKMSLSPSWWKEESKTIRDLSSYWLITKCSSGSVWGATTDRLGFSGKLALEKTKIIFNLWQRPGSWANRSPLQSPESSLHCNGVYFSVRQGHVAECLVRNALVWNLLEWNQNRSVGVEEPRKGL